MPEFFFYLIGAERIVLNPLETKKTFLCVTHIMLDNLTEEEKTGDLGFTEGD